MDSQQDFHEGTQEGVAISSEGNLTLSPHLDTLFESGELYLWSQVSDGKNLYAGSGNDGKIFKISQDGKGVIFSHLVGEVEILCLAMDRKGNLYAGTGPGGKIYRITPGGSAEVFFETGETYIWSLIFHPRGVLFAGTGENGKVFEISLEGKGEVLYDSDETHILSLLQSGEEIFAGTSPSGLLLGIHPKGETRVIYDTPLEEVRSILREENGDILVGATQKKEEEGEFSIYQVSSQRSAVTEVVSLPHLLLSMSRNGWGDLLVGTGEGELLEISPNGEWKLLLKVPASQILSILSEENQVTQGTGNMGNLYRLKDRFGREGTYLSKVFDTETLSRWGVIRWEGELPGGTKVLLETRSGNTEKADRTWSSWSDVETGLKHVSTEGKISSPPARFIQWRSRLVSDNPKITPILKEVSLAYLQTNLPPKIFSITVYPQGVGVGLQEGQRKASPLPQKKREELVEKMEMELPPGSFLLEKGFQCFGWVGEDPNGDSLLYSLSIRGVGEKRWKNLKKDIEEASYIFDTSTFPDGRYEIRVVAKDTPNNPESHALSGERVSEVFTIDNTPPRVGNIETKSLAGGTYSVTFEVEDETSALQGCSYAVDGEEWKPLYPADEVFDMTRERFEFKMESLPKGEHTLVIKAEDSLENVGAGKVVLIE